MRTDGATLTGQIRDDPARGEGAVSKVQDDPDEPGAGVAACTFVHIATRWSAGGGVRCADAAEGPRDVRRERPRRRGWHGRGCD
ncbi:hypothetical protein Cpa01nite_17210 [Cellulomonas pakistanensis]|uniref:Uncharacterized protein n=1 Tax=Cellulomonas pakistanensis TaxID=992287 RepID=A0A919U6J9_9CELL|nr:hypothetical protein Cpa01nite_17210 [Cellulomonas pakistanensis]